MDGFQTFAAAMEYARTWAYATWQDAVVLWDRVQRLMVFVGPHKEFLEGRMVMARVTPLGVEEFFV